METSAISRQQLSRLHICVSHMTKQRAVRLTVRRCGFRRGEVGGMHFPTLNNPRSARLRELAPTSRNLLFISKQRTVTDIPLSSAIANAIRCCNRCPMGGTDRMNHNQCCLCPFPSFGQRLSSMCIPDITSLNSKRVKKFQVRIKMINAHSLRVNLTINKL